MISVVLCDDDQSVLDHYQSIIESTARENNIMIKVTRCISGEQLLFMLSDNPTAVDVIYLDILMGRMNGIETAKRLRDIGCTAQIIYLTTSDEYVFEALDVEAYHYIVKDKTTVAKFKEVFLKVADKVHRSADRFIKVKIRTTTIKLNLDRILYFESRNHMVTVHTLDEDIDFYAIMDELAETLKDQYLVRIHRAFLVNCSHIEKLLRSEVVLSNGTHLTVGAKYNKQLQEQFTNYLLEP